MRRRQAASDAYSYRLDQRYALDDIIEAVIARALPTKCNSTHVVREKPPR